RPLVLAEGKGGGPARKEVALQAQKTSAWRGPRRGHVLSRLGTSSRRKPESASTQYT
ncbi:hypothetical protein SERLA73DRAFT_141607, partial [Serpula lacrymans var. lacrymans S7.3]